MAQTNRSATKTVKYLTRITRSEEDMVSEQHQFDNDDASISMQSAILAQKKAVSTAAKNVDSAKSAVPFDPEVVLTAQNILELAERKLKQLEQLQKELF